MIIHERPLSAVKKFQYLNSYLKGAAADKIRGLAETPENYDEALDLLKETSGNEEEVHNLYQQRLSTRKSLQQSFKSVFLPDSSRNWFEKFGRFGS